MGVLGHSEDIDAPFVDVLQVLSQVRHRYQKLRLCPPLKSLERVIWPLPTFDSSSSWSVLTPKRLADPPEMLDVWLTFLTPLI